MSDTKISQYYDRGHYGRGADMLKFFLIPFVYFVFLGFPTRFGGYVQILSGFVAPAYYILCGFFVLVPDSEKRQRKIKRALKSSFWFFLILFVCYLIFNIVFHQYFVESNWIPEVLRKRVIFNFLFFNMWPGYFAIGGSIWFIQSLFYAYAFFFVAEKTKLSKYYLPILIVLIIAMLFTGEFSAVVGFPYFGYPFIPGGAFTRAIPYMLIGMLIRKNADKLLSVRRLIFAALFAVGFVLALFEIYLLRWLGLFGYSGHLIGLGVSAISICCLALSVTGIKDNFASLHGESYAKRMYVMCQPVSFLITMLIISVAPRYYGLVLEYKSIVALIVCCLISIMTGVFKHLFKVRKKVK